MYLVARVPRREDKVNTLGKGIYSVSSIHKIGLALRM